MLHSSTAAHATVASQSSKLILIISSNIVASRQMDRQCLLHARLQRHWRISQLFMSLRISQLDYVKAS